MGDSFLLRLRRTVRQEGIRGVALKCLYELGYRRFLLVRRPLAEPIERPATTPDLDMAWLEPAAIPDYLAIHPSARAGDVAEALGAGDRCLLARHEGRVVGSLWGSTRHMESFPGLPMEADEAYLYESFTIPCHRGRSVAPALVAEMLRAYRDAGRRSAVMLVFAANAAALRACAKAGFRVETVVTRVAIGPFRRDRCRPA